MVWAPRHLDLPQTKALRTYVALRTYIAPVEFRQNTASHSSLENQVFMVHGHLGAYYYSQNSSFADITFSERRPRDSES